MSKSTAVTTVNTESVVGNFTQKELDTLKATIARGTTNEQFALFVQTCVNSGLNPFLNHVHCIVYQGKDGPTMSIQIAVEGILYLARKTEGYKGVEAQLVHENDEFSYDATNKQIKHEVGFPRGKVIGGYAIAKREGFDDVVVLMEVDEVEHMKKGRNGHMWREWFNDMFKKHIIKRAAKLQYGIEVAEDEPVKGGSIDNIPEYRPEPKNITPKVEQIETQPDPDTEENEDKEKEKQLKAEIKSKFKQLGITNAEGRAEFFEEHGIAFENPKKPTMSEITGLIRVLNMVIAQQSDADELPE